MLERRYQHRLDPDRAGILDVLRHEAAIRWQIGLAIRACAWLIIMPELNQGHNLASPQGTSSTGLH